MSQPPASMRGVAPPSAEEAIASGVADFAGLARRGVVLIAACAIGCGLLAGAYLSMQTPLFRATAEILVDPAALQVVGKDIVRSDTAASIDFANIDSQALVIVSNSILDQLVDELKLDQDPVFRGGPGLLARLTGADTGGGPVRATILENLRRSIVVRRVDASLVFDVTVSHPNAEKAAAIANRLVSIYLRQGSEGRGSAARRANDTLLGQLSNLRRQLSDAETAVEKFRSDNGLISTGEAGLIVNQQLKDLYSEISTAETELARVSARKDQLAKLGPDALLSDRIPEAINSPSIVALRTQYAVAAREAARMAETLLPRHPRLMEARGELSAARKLLADELDRVRGSVTQEFDQAKANLGKLRERAGSLTRSQVTSSEAEIRLRQLESEAAAVRSVYEASLGRAKELEQQAAIDTSNSRLISAAAVPVRPSRAPALIVLPAALIFGACLGLALVFLKDLIRGAAPNAKAVADMFGVAGFADLRLGPNGRLDERDRSRMAAVARRLQRLAASNEPAIVMVAATPGLDPVATRAVTTALGRALADLGDGGWICRQQGPGAPMHVERIAAPLVEPQPRQQGAVLEREAAGVLRSREGGASERSNYLIYCDDDPANLAVSAPSADAILLVFAAGATPRRALRETVATLDPTAERIIAALSIQSPSAASRFAPGRGLFGRSKARTEKAWA
ncbi:GumC family protein [Chenggangzhangella methanolivorans]|uniref:GumC family protein n=1 Tax=Chenggangzhangella methanolivorans TaxID=1437009 RepID=UPI00360EBBAE